MTAGLLASLTLIAAACGPSDATLAGASAGSTPPSAGATTASTGSATAPMAAADPAEVRRTIEEANTRAAAGLIAGDANLATGNYAEDAVVMQPGMEAMRGRSAVIEGLRGMMSSMPITAASFTTDDVVVSGDLAIETGTYALTMQPRGGPPMPDNGKYLSVWKRQADGSWKIMRDINNSNAAPK